MTGLKAVTKPEMILVINGVSEKMFTSHDLALETKTMVYQAVCISLLLYCSESWTAYRRQIKLLGRYHMFSLQKFFGIKWRDKIPHRTIMVKTECPSLEYLLERNQLRWNGHVVRMPDNTRPKQLLYGELCEGRMSAGQLNRYKDAARAAMKACATSRQMSSKSWCSTGQPGGPRYRLD